MEEGSIENRRHMVDYYKVPLWNAVSPYQIKEQTLYHMNVKLAIVCDERDTAFRERDRAVADKKSASDERDIAVKQRDDAISERDDAIRERDNAIAALQFQESTMNAILSGSARGLKRMNPTNHHSDDAQFTYCSREECITDAFSLSVVPCEAARARKGMAIKMKLPKSPRKVRKISEDLNRRLTTDGSKVEWDANDFSCNNQISFDESTMPVPVCSCTGVPRQCYKWSSGGWQSSCCTNTLSLYPLPQLPNKRHARMGGRKMSGSVFSRLLTRLASGGHDLAVPVDLKSYWAKHGTNRYITIK